MQMLDEIRFLFTWKFYYQFISAFNCSCWSWWWTLGRHEEVWWQDTGTWFWQFSGIKIVSENFEWSCLFAFIHHHVLTYIKFLLLYSLLILLALCLEIQAHLRKKQLLPWLLLWRYHSSIKQPLNLEYLGGILIR